MILLRKIRSVRVALTVWYAGILLAAFLVFGLAVYFYLHRVLHDALESRLTAEVEWIAEEISRIPAGIRLTPTLGDIPLETRQNIEDHLDLLPRNFSVKLTGMDGKDLFRRGSFPSGNLVTSTLLGGRPTIYTLESASEEVYSVASHKRERITVHIAFPEKRIRNVLRHTLVILFTLAPAALVIAVWGGWIVAGRVLRPIGRITRIASRFSAQTLNERIPERRVDDELGKLIKTLNLGASRLEASFEQMKLFSMNVAHELKTPLTVLRGEAELALGNPPDAEKSRELAETFLEETVRISLIVDDLLTLAKGDAGQAEVIHEPVELAGILEDLLDEAQILAQEKSLRVELQENPPITVSGDETRLRRLFRSLVSNAVRFTDNGGLIRICSRREGEEVRVSVEDTGIGIPADSVAKIFDRFYRVDQARSRERGGSGLGLSLAKWIAESHGGRIEVASEVGRGSRFEVILPVAGDSATGSSPGSS